MANRHTRIVERAMTRLKLRQLRLLVAVGQHGSIQNAAHDLNISQPAATKMIQDLELDFEVKLFDRTNRGVVPTVFGAALIRHGKLIFSQVSNAAQELDDLNEGNSGRVVVGTLLAASPSLLPMAVEGLLKDRPKVAIKIVEGTNEVLMPALLAGEIDMVVGRLPSHRHRENITQEKFFDERVLAVAGTQHPLAQETNVSFEQLKPYGWILPPVETTLRRQTDQFFVRQDQYVPRTAIESVSYLANRSLLRSHDFIGLMPAHVAALDIESGLLASIDWVAPFGAGPVGVSYRGPQSLSPAGQSFLAALHAAAGQVARTLGPL
ncbi:MULTISPECIES: LysR substrate-binding domain-containing protein [Roseovarius]|uniref:LysR family transcriptional regulator n=1 Tax=Roseovarius nubinhibens TaxID=314263 RepID=A0A348WH58_9RHOB|nr:LysR substrate-binding domain-containing protein [Roseovarius sp.]MAN60062.1 LysR family transcriptional regulator [Flavobacteriaceae bacterium]MAO26611.1 LysR family transcriptional regulator [Roseovarius sp.]MAZ21184.1 LysR family transcriptional regulator [Roseovarius sp.]HAR53870.1 LysR family transcriptional regulator [Roseovarius nubinhibens]|tara:strand:+ start:316 stop:1281 length:966 start_codon:yes stop_codon:yes gene_type:complete